MSQDAVFQLAALVASLVAGGAGVYAAIRAELIRAIITAENAQSSAGTAHKRIDMWIERHHGKA